MTHDHTATWDYSGGMVLSHITCVGQDQQCEPARYIDEEGCGVEDFGPNDEFTIGTHPIKMVPYYGDNTWTWER